MGHITLFLDPTRHETLEELRLSEEQSHQAGGLEYVQGAGLSMPHFVNAAFDLETEQ